MKDKTENKGLALIKAILASKVQRTALLIGLAALLVVITAASTYSIITHESKTTKIGFENIGELATQAAYCVEVNLTDSFVKLWGWNLPFTQSKYIYSYNVTIKAGCDFGKIEWEATKNEVHVKLPEMKVLSCEIDPESFKVYHEKESVFNRITLEENNEAFKTLRDNAVNSAIENGLFDNARANAELLITAFLRADYPEDKYTIVFDD